jgi:hypothetical protein
MQISTMTGHVARLGASPRFVVLAALVACAAHGTEASLLTKAIKKAGTEISKSGQMLGSAATDLAEGGVDAVKEFNDEVYGDDCTAVDLRCRIPIKNFGSSVRYLPKCASLATAVGYLLDRRAALQLFSLSGPGLCRFPLRAASKV